MSTTPQQLELIDFLKEQSIFKVLDQRIIEGISPVFTQQQFGPGQIIFKQGDAADAMYIIRSGSVEVIQGEPAKILAYLTAGECFGEMALVHETPRTATVRVPEETTVVRIPKRAIKELRSKFPEVTSAVADIINHRLAGTLPFQAPGLQGNLAFFDLATVIQTVVASRQAGILTLFGRTGKAVAQLILQEGAITRASFKHLVGERAILELITRNDPLDFIFERQSVEGKPVDSQLAKRKPHMLLIEGARRSDELPKLSQNLGWPNTIFHKGSKLPDWSKFKDEESVTIGQKLWLLMDLGCSVEEMTQKLPYDRYTVLTVLKEMLGSSCIRKEIAARENLQALEKTMQLPKAVVEAQMVRPAAPLSRLRPVPEPMRLINSPSKVVAAVNAINMVTSNLASLLGKNEVRFIIQQALRKTADAHPHLASLRIYPDSVTLDLRSASPEFSASTTSVKSLEQLMRNFIELASKSHKATE